MGPTSQVIPGFALLVAHDEELPGLSVDAARRFGSRIEDLANQIKWLGIRLQTLDRPRRVDDLEESWILHRVPSPPLGLAETRDGLGSVSGGEAHHIDDVDHEGCGVQRDHGPDPEAKRVDRRNIGQPS